MIERVGYRRQRPFADKCTSTPENTHTKAATTAVQKNFLSRDFHRRLVLIGPME
jgi:hypothetical protein